MLDRPLYWSATKQALFNGYSNFIRLFGTLISVTVLKWLKFHDTSILLIALASTTLKLVMYGSAQTDAVMFLAGILGFGGFLGFPVSKSIVAQLVPADEVGKIYALFSLTSDGAHLAGQFGLMGIYMATRRSIMPGFVFFIMAAGILVALGIVIWIHIDYKRYRTQKTAQIEPATQTDVALGVVISGVVDGACAEISEDVDGGVSTLPITLVA